MAYYSLDELANNLTPSYAEDLNNLELGTEKSLFGAAFSYGLATNFTQAGINFVKDVLGDEEKFSPEIIKEKTGYDTDVPLTNSQLNYKLRVKDAELEMAKAAKGYSKIGGGSVAILGAIAGGFLDPATIVTSLAGIGLVGQGLKAFNSAKVISTLNSSSRAVRLSARAGTFGAVDAGVNVGIGVSIAKNQGREYGLWDAVIDSAFGLVFGTAFSGGSAKRLTNKDIKGITNVDIKAAAPNETVVGLEVLEKTKKIFQKAGDDFTPNPEQWVTLNPEQKTDFAQRLLDFINVAENATGGNAAKIVRLIDDITSDPLSYAFVFGDKEVAKLSYGLMGAAAKDRRYVGKFHELQNKFKANEKNLTDRDKIESLASNVQEEVNTKPVDPTTPAPDSVASEAIDVVDEGIDIDERLGRVDELLEQNKIPEEGATKTEQTTEPIPQVTEPTPKLKSKLDDPVLEQKLADKDTSSLEELNLSNKDLSGRRFDSKFLTNTKMNKSNFENSDFSRARFFDTFASKSNFKNGDFQDARFSKANIAESDFSNANLQDASFRRTNLHKAKFENANLEGVIFSGSKVTETSFKGANLENAAFIDEQIGINVFEKRQLNKVNFENANLKGAYLQGIDFTTSKLKGANLEGAFIKDAVFTEKQLKQVKGLNKANISAVLDAEVIDHIRGKNKLSVVGRELSDDEIRNNIIISAPKKRQIKSKEKAIDTKVIKIADTKTTKKPTKKKVTKKPTKKKVTKKPTKKKVTKKPTKKKKTTKKKKDDK